MSSIHTHQSLDTITELSSDIAEAISQLERQLQSLRHRIDSDTEFICDMRKAEPLTEEDGERLLRLNRHLASLEHFLSEVSGTLSPKLASKIADPDDPMYDFEIDAELDYALRENDPEWDDNEDNYLSSRTESIKDPHYGFSVRGWRDCELIPNILNSEPHCWLFHDLYDHQGGIGEWKVPVPDCLRLGEVWVDVVIRQQYRLNLDTGQWVKSKR